MAGRAQWCLVTLVLWLGCSAPPPVPPALPAGIAELQLPSDAASLRRLAIDEEAAGRVERRREVLVALNRQLLMAPPETALAPELFDFVTVLAPRMEVGAISPAWGSYLYTTYQREMGAERPDGRPRRSSAEVAAVLDGWVDYYRIRANPRVARPSLDGQAFEATQEWRSERRLGR